MSAPDDGFVVEVLAAALPHRTRAEVEALADAAAELLRTGAAEGGRHAWALIAADVFEREHQRRPGGGDAA